MENSTELFPGGPASIENWRAAITNEPPLAIYEVPLFTDAEIISEHKYGPYSLLNTVPMSRGIVAPAIVLRYPIHLSSVPDEMGKTNNELYHGGSQIDEIAAFLSLALRIRIRAGEYSRRFEMGGDPLGHPRNAGTTPTPVLLQRTDHNRRILANAFGQRDLRNAQCLDLLPRISRGKLIALLRSARLYQDALWLAESETSLAWTMLVSAVESAANCWRNENDSAKQRLQASKSELYDYLEKLPDPSILEVVANSVADSLGSTKKFIDFLLEFLPSEPSERPEICIDWSPQAMRKPLSKIYGHRSKALHEGKPFPAPMCSTPLKLRGWAAPAEQPLGIINGAYGAQWAAKETPMHFHIFEYIASGALMKWWMQETT